MTANLISWRWRRHLGQIFTISPNFSTNGLITQKIHILLICFSPSRTVQYRGQSQQLKDAIPGLNLASNLIFREWWYFVRLYWPPVKLGSTRAHLLASRRSDAGDKLAACGGFWSAGGQRRCHRVRLRLIKCLDGISSFHQFNEQDKSWWSSTDFQTIVMWKMWISLQFDTRTFRA